MRAGAVLVLVTTGALMGLDGGTAGAHLFHKMYEPPETQMTRDTRLLQLLLDDPSERHELARRVWEGTERVRLKPGGFRRWLVRPNEPGMVFKGDYQLARWSGSLKEEASRIDRTYGTTIAGRIERAYLLAFGRPATAAERATGEEYLARVREKLQAAGAPAGAAWESYVRAVLMANEFVYVN